MVLNKKNFGARLKQVRLESNLTGGDLAKLVDLQRTTIVNFESGLNSPSLETLYKLANVLNVSADYLMGLPATKPPPKWVSQIMAELETLDRAGQGATKALLLGLKKSKE
jgi:transcriptional regulator with XRE-family HTH domain